MKISTIQCLMTMAFLCAAGAIHAQNIGLQTTDPQAPVHIGSSGQVNTPGGLLLLGHRSEGHMEVDFDLLQSKYGAAGTLLPLRLQPIGGEVGINTFLPDAPLHVSSSGQVNTPGGLVLLGHRTEGHMEMDFDMMQSRYGTASWLTLNLQPLGGNLNVGNGLIFANRAGSFVGINTGNPDTELQVHGEMRLTTAGLSASQKDKVAIHGQLESQAMLGLGWLKIASGIGGLAEGGSTRSSLIDTYEMYYRSEGAHRWFINERPNVNTPDMILDVAGNLGIGLPEPERRLHVAGGTSISNLTTGGVAQIGPTNGPNLIMDYNEIQARSNASAAQLFLQYWGGNIAMAGATSGLVGIGTNSPAAKLHLNGGQDASYTLHGYMMIGSQFNNNIVMDADEILARNAGGAANMNIQRDGGHLLLCALKQGQVGIGIDNIADMPSSSYLLAVDGKIISEEIRVELQANWPDYVFDSDYALTPLDELSQQISELGHLPNMPSAEEVEAQGFELGDMQRRLVEKVEELTLYVIALNEANMELKEEVSALKKKRRNRK